MSIRIPVSLKFDDKSDFYNDYIYDMKEHKTLSYFIVNILKAYYENTTVRDAVDEVLQIEDPLSEARRQIARAQIEHQKSVIGTSMIEQSVRKTKNALSDADLSPSTEQKPVEFRLETLEKSLPSIDEKMNLILSLIQSGSVDLNALKTPATEALQEPTITLPPTLPTIHEEPSIPVELPPLQPLTGSEPSTLSENLAPINTAQTVLPTIQPLTQILEPVSTPKLPTNAPVFTDDDEDEEPATQAPPVKRPASFGKALKSTKKD